MANGGTPEILTLRVRLGENEFEATGASEIVVGQFAAWQRLVAPPTAPASEPTPDSSAAAKRQASLEIFTVDARHSVVTLRLYPAGKAAHADAALLLLYGIHQVLGEQGRAITATRLKGALAASGHPDARLDRTLARSAAMGWVKKDGERKGSTYQLTTSGYQRAEVLAGMLHSTLTPAPRP